MGSITKRFFVNSVSSILSQGIQLLFNFIIRREFINVFGIELLGLNSTFTNILSFLNLTELGIGFAITYHLYAPLKHKDYNTFNNFIYLYKKFYEKIIWIILFCGILLIPLLPLFVKKNYNELIYLSIIFFLQLLQSLSTYIFSYRRIIFNVNEKNYIVSKYEMFFNIITSILQIIILFYFKNYYLFCIVVIIKNLLLNILLHRLASKEFVYLDENHINKSDITEVKKQITVDLKNVIVVKIGSYVLHATDYLLISMLFGAIASGKIANYSMIFITFQTLILTAMNSVQSIIGNEAQSNNKNHVMNIICKYTNVMFFISMIFCPIAFCLADNFILLWIGDEFLLPKSISLLYSINIFLMMLSNPISLLFGSLGYYNYDKKYILISASLNIIVSILLSQVIGILGILIGTMIAISIYWISRYNILKNVYFNDMSPYRKTILIEFICLLIGYISIYLIDIIFNNHLSLFMFIIKGILYIFIIMLILIFYQKINRKITRRKRYEK